MDSACDELLCCVVTDELESAAEELKIVAEELLGVGSMAEETPEDTYDDEYFVFDFSSDEDAVLMLELLTDCADCADCAAEERASTTVLLRGSWLRGMSVILLELDSLASELVGVGSGVGPTMLSDSSLQPLMTAAVANPNVAAMAVFVALENLMPLVIFLFSIFIKTPTQNPLL